MEVIWEECDDPVQLVLDDTVKGTQIQRCRCHRALQTLKHCHAEQHAALCFHMSSSVFGILNCVFAIV